MNKYVEFVSDEDFFNEVKKVIEKFMIVVEYERNYKFIKNYEINMYYL